MVAVRGFVVALVAASVCGASGASSGSSRPPTQQLRAVGSQAVEPHQSQLEDGADAESFGLGGAADSWRDLGDKLFSRASDVLHRVPLPPGVIQLVGALSSESLRADEGGVEQSSHQQVLLILLYYFLYLLWVFFFMGLWIGLIALIGYFYVQNKQYPVSEEGLATPEQQASFTDWKFGFCSCFGDCEVCCCAWWCPCIRWGETLSLVDGLIIFWVGFGIYLSFTMLSWATSIPLCWLLLTVICTAYRQEIRIKFEMRKVGGLTYVTDCLLYAFCACCALSQEARHIEEALKFGHKAVRVPSKE